MTRRGVLFLSLCVAVCLGDGGQVEEDVAFEPTGVQYRLDFTWPIDNVLSLPSVGEQWQYQNEELFRGENGNLTGPKWLFRLSCSDEKFGDARNMYLALRLESLPDEFSYLYGGAECGILDNNGRLKNLEKTGNNALLPSLNFRFDPFFKLSVLTKNAGSFIKAPNETMTVKCSVKGQLKEEMIPFNGTIDDESVNSDYPSYLYVQEEKAVLKETGEFTVKLVVAIYNFVDWPMVYHTGTVSFNITQPSFGFVYQIRTYNPANSRYPLYLWLESLPEGKNAFKGSCTCGLIGQNVKGETVSVDTAYPDYFFAFPNALEVDRVNSNLKPTPYGLPAAEISCEMKGTLTIDTDS